MKFRSRGFTIVELLTVLVLMTVVIAVALPAIQKTRSVDRRSDCMKKMKAIGLAMHNYHEVFQTFAPGFVKVGTKPGDVGGTGWGFYSLVFLEQAPLYKKFNSNLNITDAVNAPVVGAVLPAFRCSDDKGPVQVTLANGSAWGTTNYVGNFGVGMPKSHSNEGDDIQAKKMQGIFGHNSRIRIRDCRDGTSNIFMVGERQLPTKPMDWNAKETSGNVASFWAGDPEVVQSEAQSILGSNAGESSTGLYALAGPLCEGSYNPVSTFNPTNPRCSTQGEGANGNPILPNRKVGAAGARLADEASLGFSSPHPGGTQILLGDGSVRFVSDTVDVATWINLSRRSDGQVLGAF